MSTDISEAIAYIVQCQLVLIKSGDRKRLSSPNAAKDLVFELAWKIAVKLQQGIKPSATEKSNLRAAVGRHPFYMKNASADAGFNGV